MPAARANPLLVVAAGWDHHNAGLVAVAAAEETAGIAENLRADEGIGIGAHLDRALLATAVPVDRITLLRPDPRASRLSPLPIAPALLLASRLLGQGRPGCHPQHRYGKNDANGNSYHFGLRHGRVSLMNFELSAHAIGHAASPDGWRAYSTKVHRSSPTISQVRVHVFAIT